jgi:hypothetical protein
MDRRALICVVLSLCGASKWVVDQFGRLGQPGLLVSARSGTLLPIRPRTDPFAAVLWLRLPRLVPQISVVGWSVDGWFQPLCCGAASTSSE